MTRFPMTPLGESLLRQELKKLKTIDRIAIVKAIAEAREFGDLKENAEYHAAKEQQGLIESRIKDIEFKLTDSQVIDVTNIEPTGKVIFGTTVELEDLDEEESITYQIVGEDEADIAKGKISINSPLSRSLIGKIEGDIFTFKTQVGTKEYEIISVKHK
tara:strand:+ start:891 stop:1367 length:477 start_codon:yes stop_codon:yes gene_type:complete